MDAEGSLHWWLTAGVALAMPAPFIRTARRAVMRNIIYIIGLIVVVLFILSMLGLR